MSRPQPPGLWEEIAALTPKPPGWMNKIREDGTEALSDILRKIPGAKNLIFDPLLITPLDFFIGPGFIQANEVTNFQKSYSYLRFPII